MLIINFNITKCEDFQYGEKEKTQNMEELKERIKV